MDNGKVSIKDLPDLDLRLLTFLDLQELIRQIDKIEGSRFHTIPAMAEKKGVDPGKIYKIVIEGVVRHLHACQRMDVSPDRMAVKEIIDDALKSNVYFPQLKTPIRLITEEEKQASLKASKDKAEKQIEIDKLEEKIIDMGKRNYTPKGVPITDPLSEKNQRLIFIPIDDEQSYLNWLKNQKFIRIRSDDKVETCGGIEPEFRWVFSTKNIGSFPKAPKKQLDKRNVAVRLKYFSSSIELAKALANHFKIALPQDLIDKYKSIEAAVKTVPTPEVNGNMSNIKEQNKTDLSNWIFAKAKIGETWEVELPRLFAEAQKYQKYDSFSLQEFTEIAFRKLVNTIKSPSGILRAFIEFHLEEGDPEPQLQKLNKAIQEYGFRKTNNDALLLIISGIRNEKAKAVGVDKIEPADNQAVSANKETPASVETSTTKDSSDGSPYADLLKVDGVEKMNNRDLIRYYFKGQPVAKPFTLKSVPDDFERLSKFLEINKREIKPATLMNEVGIIRGDNEVGSEHTSKLTQSNLSEKTKQPAGKLSESGDQQESLASIVRRTLKDNGDFPDAYPTSKEYRVYIASNFDVNERSISSTVVQIREKIARENAKKLASMQDKEILPAPPAVITAKTKVEETVLKKQTMIQQEVVEPEVSQNQSETSAEETPLSEHVEETLKGESEAEKQVVPPSHEIIPAVTEEEVEEPSAFGAKIANLKDYNRLLTEFSIRLQEDFGLESTAIRLKVQMNEDEMEVLSSIQDNPKMLDLLMRVQRSGIKLEDLVTKD